MLYDPERRWHRHHACDEGDFSLFFAEGGQLDRLPSKAAQEKWDQAKEICFMCPVLLQCRRDTLGEEYGVWGGYDQYERHQIRRRLPKAAKGWPPERRLAWGRALRRLRDGGVSWKEMTLQTGIPARLAEVLIEGWEEELDRLRQPVAKVVDLALPEPERSGPQFPDRPGSRHAWVRHTGSVSDAFYRGQTEDGRWISATTFSGRGNVQKWFPAADVQLYHPQPVVIIEYKERPDGPTKSQRRRARERGSAA